MRKLVLMAILAIVGNSIAMAQTVCSITITPTDTTVCPGSVINIVSEATLLNGNQSFDFNSSSIPSGWSVSGAATFNAPCGNNPSNTPYYWASTSGGYPNITTPNFDVTCGGFIEFEMVYGLQGAPQTNCDGPDLMNEGIALQYSTDNGLTWTTIIYYVPDGTTMTTIPSGTNQVANGPTSLTTWDSYSVPIPTSALTVSTQFRWFQPVSSPGGYDNWGLDNIVINAIGAPCDNQSIVNWSNGFMDTTSFTFTAMSDTTFIAYVYDTAGNYMCQSAPIFINVLPDNLTYSLVDTTYSYCPTTNPAVSVTNVQGGNPAITYSWSNGSTTANTILSANNVEQGVFTYNVTITDGCGYVHEDSVVLVVNKLLKIDSLEQYPTPACVIDGTVVAYVSGTSGQPLYNWTGPGSGNPSFINSTVWTDKPSGWYYFTVTDALCTSRDSIFLEQLPPPTAGFTQDLLIGCTPFEVTFTNTSQNASNYSWNFGNGNTLNTTSTAPITETFYDASTIQLIAFAGPCSDTAYSVINTNICGCMDPLAINYDPTANVDNGTCILPNPIIEVPNVFTPNQDGENDEYKLIAVYQSEIRITITNRWGQVVYTGKGLNPGWDGKIDGTPALEGVYFVQYEVDNLMKTSTITGQTPVHLYR